MHTVPVARKVFLSALVALTLLVGALFIATPKASASLEQCANGYVCVWELSNFSGAFSAWPASSTGCHSHINNPNIRSAWNRTGYYVRLGGWGTIGPGSSIQLNSGWITGEICWPV